MRKIMFNDHYGLTRSVLDGRKTQTRRIIEGHTYVKPMATLCQGKLRVNEIHKQEEISRYAVGETLAVAQCLKELDYDARDTQDGHIWGLDHTPAWKNKMFVSAKQCKHHIRITAIRLERLQDISDEDCLKEGIRPWDESEETDPRVRQSLAEIKAAGITPYQITGHWDCYSSPREAFASLIDKVSGKGTWEKNPWVFVYDFLLIRQ